MFTASVVGKFGIDVLSSSGLIDPSAIFAALAASSLFDVHTVKTGLAMLPLCYAVRRDSAMGGFDITYCLGFLLK